MDQQPVGTKSVWIIQKDCRAQGQAVWEAGLGWEEVLTGAGTRHSCSGFVSVP